MVMMVNRCRGRVKGCYVVMMMNRCRGRVKGCYVVMMVNRCRKSQGLLCGNDDEQV